MKKFAILFTFLAVAACSSDDDSSDNCTDVYTAGLIVTVQDGGVMMTDGVTVTATDGDYIEELALQTDMKFHGAFERAGTYKVTVTAAGYQPYVSEDLMVDEDECHVITEEITVQLQPEAE
ncbi:carboxypeptidase-like regulatory domain-containing protein [Flavobacterium rhizosphaerae]|uniref:Carboxypeptidase-like regulatory domain-containing protein n=1 Tax=Flavobacterium rhizosphaerae TaxID=3163298 RepID=A0ABW8YY56_9FLAO